VLQVPESIMYVQTLLATSTVVVGIEGVLLPVVKCTVHCTVKWREKSL
jgi:hypothetical protein